MEKHHPIEAPKSPDTFEPPYEKLMKMLDILMMKKYDINKIGEMVRLVMYLQSLARGKDATPPEPDPKLQAQIIDRKTQKDNQPVEFSPDENFARFIYYIIPGGAKNNLEAARQAFETFLYDLVKSTENTKPIGAGNKKPVVAEQPANIPATPSPELTTQDKLEKRHVFFDKKAPEIK